MMKKSHSKKSSNKKKASAVVEKKKLQSLQHKIQERTKELEQSLSLVRATLESTADGILMVSAEGKIEDYNQKFVDLLKIPKYITDSKDQVQGLQYMFSVIEDPEGLMKVMQEMQKHPEKQGEIGELRFKDGRIFERYSQPRRVGNKIVGRVWSFRDITERRKVEEALRLRERAIEASTHGVIISSAKAPYPIIYVNPAFEKITGYLREEAIGKNIDFLKGRDSEQAELKKVKLALNERSEEEAIFRSYRKDGQLFWNEMHIAPVPDIKGEISHFVGIVVDVTDRKLMEDQLVHQATHDALTDLPNRSLLADRLKQSIIHAKRDNTLVAVLFLDLDFFKLTNDSMGHGPGDELLKMVSKRLVESVRETDSVARIGGDEFVVISTSIKEPENVIPLAQKLLKVIAKPFKLADRQVNITVSIGISVYPLDGKNIETIMKNADMAMYQAKDLGRNNFQFYTAQLNKRLIERLHLEEKLREAIKLNRFELYYQPLVDLNTHKIVGTEALIRMKEADGSIISPAGFINFAEEIGLIVPIGNWVLEAACKQAKMWQEQKQTTKIAVNISSKQLQQPDFVKSVAKTIKKYMVNPDCLELELTESVLMENTEKNLEILSALRNLGLKLVIDDFGTGYSSLSYLSRFPVHKLKIDFEFIKNVTSNSTSATIVQTILAMAKNLNLKVVAEGIETKEQLDFLTMHNCDQGQGFYLYKPMNTAALEPLLLQTRC